jgi:hypothetical protein
MLHGKGTGGYSEDDQSFLTKSYEEDRKKGLRGRNKLSDEDKLYYEISGAQGGGMTDEHTFEIEQFPFPIDTTIRKKQKLDVRKVRPELGEMSD